MTALRMLRAAAISTLLSTISSPAVRAVIIVVEADGSGEHPTIQSGINASVSGDVVELGDGTFRGPGNRDLRFSGRAVTLRSASGDPSLCIIDAEGAGQVLRFFSETSATIVENVAIVNGSGIDGGCVYVVNLAEPVIRGCIIAGGDARRGGGVFMDGDRAPRFEGCWLIDNEADDGGALYAIDGTRVVLTDCVVAGNRATGQGGAGLWFGGGARPIITGTTVALNEADGPGGGLFVHAQTSVDMQRSIFWENDASNGPDIHVWDLSCEVLLGCSIARPERFGGFDGVVLTGGVIPDDPLFCRTTTTFEPYDPEAFALEAASPCLPTNNSCSTLMGAQSSCDGAKPTLRLSWGAIKSRF